MSGQFTNITKTQKTQDTYQRDALVHCKCGGNPSPVVFPGSLSVSFLRFYLFIFRQRGMEGEISMCGCLLCPLLEAWPATQTCALTGIQTGDLLVLTPALNPLSPTNQGFIVNF